jgi:hypothetical protein
MSDQVMQMVMNNFGGVNISDLPDDLMMRSHEQTEFGFQQRFPVESPDMVNVDFDSLGIRKRRGSKLADDLTTAAVADEKLIRGIAWKNPDTGTEILVIVGKKSTYTNQSGSWAQINNSASTAYTHSTQSVTKVSFAMIDGHLFIGTDGANNYIQVYRSGADLDDEMNNDNTNVYENAYDSAVTDVITGTWTKACYLLCEIESRLVFSNGNTLIEFTPPAQTSDSGIWDLAGVNYGFYQSAGNITALMPFSPEFSDSFSENLYIGTTAGIEIATGMGAFQTELQQDQSIALTDSLVRVEGSSAPLNHQSYCVTKNWLAYLAEDKNIYFMNGTRVLDIGRRARNWNYPLKLLESLHLATARDIAYAFYDSIKDQAIFAFTTATTNINDTIIVIDLKKGEPVFNEPKESYERRIRLLPWKIKDPATNPWFVSMFQQASKIVGIRGTENDEKTFEINVLSDDFDSSSIPVESEWWSPMFTGGAEHVSKQWLQQKYRGIILGAWTVSVHIYKNRDSSLHTKTFNFTTTGFANYDDSTEAVYDTAKYASEGTLRASSDIDIYSESIQSKISNSVSNEDFAISSIGMRYKIGADDR